MTTLQLDNVKVKIGRIIEVCNTDKPKFSNAKRSYMAIQVEDAQGKNEECLLFTRKELERARHRAARNL